MPAFDLGLDLLAAYRAEPTEPIDFDEFWTRTIAEAREFESSAIFEEVLTNLTEIDVFDVTFPGFGGDPVKGWFLAPRRVIEPLPTIVEFVGYGGGRGLPQDRLAWVAAGYAHFVMDTRGQGSVWGSGGDTLDPHGSGPATPGFLTRGIEDREGYYYRRVFTDAVRAVDAVRAHHRVDATRVILTGGSQGGGIAIAAAGILDNIAAVMPDVPFLSHFPRALELADRASPYAEIVRYLSVHRADYGSVMQTLSYFDAVNFASRATAPSLYSVALMDQVCPPSTVFAAHNNHRGPAEMVVYPFNEHEGGGGHQWSRQAEWLAGLR